MKCHIRRISSESSLFAKTDSIFWERNIIIWGNYNMWPPHYIQWVIMTYLYLYQKSKVCWNRNLDWKIQSIMLPWTIFNGIFFATAIEYHFSIVIRQYGPIILGWWSHPVTFSLILYVKIFLQFLAFSYVCIQKNKGSLTLAMGKCLWFSVKIKVCQLSLSSPWSYPDLSTLWLWNPFSILNASKM